MPLGAYPIDELVARVAQKRLETINYISEVIRESRNVINWTPKDRQIILTKTNPERAEQFDTIGNPPGLAYSMNLNIHCHVMQSEQDSDPVESLLSVMAADAIRAITNDVNWHQFEGTCLNATIGSPDRKTFDGAFDSITVPISVLFRVAENDPYLVRC
jgi:hypothetical protein